MKAIENMKTKIIISPPCYDQISFIKNKFNSRIITVDELNHHLQDINKDWLNGQQELLIIGTHITKQQRKDTINKLKYFFDAFEIEYILFDIEEEKVLFDLFLNKNFNEVLPIYMYYKYLDLSDVDKFEPINIKSEYDNLIENGSKAIIVDIHALLLNSTNNRIMLNIPNNDLYINVNLTLCNYLKQLNNLGYMIILTHCESDKYAHITLEQSIEVYNKIIESLDFDIAGLEIKLDANLENKFHKPHPFFLFNIMHNYVINPYASFYFGYQKIDEQLAKYAGINFINCYNLKKLEDLEGIFNL